MRFCRQTTAGFLVVMFLSVSASGQIQPPGATPTSMTGGGSEDVPQCLGCKPCKKEPAVSVIEPPPGVPVSVSESGSGGGPSLPGGNSAEEVTVHGGINLGAATGHERHGAGCLEDGVLAVTSDEFPTERASHVYMPPSGGFQVSHELSRRPRVGEEAGCLDNGPQIFEFPEPPYGSEEIGLPSDRFEGVTEERARVSIERLLSGGFSGVYGALPPPPPPWPGRFDFSKLGEYGVVWWSPPAPVSYLVKYDIRNRTKSVFLPSKAPNLFGWWAVDKVFNWSGHLLEEYVYDLEGYLTERRYGEGVVERITQVGGNLARIFTVEHWVDRDGDHENDDLGQLFHTTQYTFRFLVLHGVWRTEEIEFGARRYVVEPSSAGLHDVSATEEGNLRYVMSHDWENSFISEVRRQLVSDGAVLKSERIFSVEWEKLETGDVYVLWRVRSTRGADGVTKEYGYQNGNKVVVKTATRETTYTFDGVERVTEIKEDSIYNPRAQSGSSLPEDPQRITKISYYPGTKSPQMATRIEYPSGEFIEATRDSTTGQILSLKAPGPNGTDTVIGFSYDTWWRGFPLKSVTDSLGNTTEFFRVDGARAHDWDISLPVTSERVVYPSAQSGGPRVEALVEYTPEGFVSRTVSPAGVSTEYRYDSENRNLLQSVVSGASGGGASDPSTSYAWYERDYFGFPTRFVEGVPLGSSGGSVERYLRDGTGRITELQVPSGDGRPETRIKNFYGWRGDAAVVEAWNRDYRGQLPVGPTGVSGGAEWIRLSDTRIDAAGRPLVSYSFRGPLFASSGAYSADNYEKASYSYDEATGLPATVVSGGVSTSYRFDGYGDLFDISVNGTVLEKRATSAIGQRSIREVLAQGQGANLSYVRSEVRFRGGALESFHSSTGRRVEVQHDARGLPTRVEEYMGSELRRVVEAAHDSLGQTTSVTLVPAQPGTGVSPLRVMEFGYGSYGQVLWRKNHRGEETLYNYDSIGRIRKEWFGDSSVVYGYAPHRNWVDRVTQTEGGESYVYELLRDLRGRVVEATERGRAGAGAAARVTKSSYNSFGMMEASWDAAGKLSRWSTGLDGFTWWSSPYEGITVRATRSVLPDGSEAVERYDSVGRKSEFLFNPLGQLEREKRLPGGGFTEYQYDAASNLIGKLSPNGVLMTAAYDPFGRAVQASWTRGSESITRMNTFQEGRLVRRSETGAGGTSSVEYAYDIFGFLSGEQTTLTDGRVSRVGVHRLSPSGGGDISTQRYDFNPQAVTFEGARLNERLNFGYDDQSRVTSYGFSGGAFGLPEVAAEFGYVGRTLREVVTAGGKLRSSARYDAYGLLEGVLSEWDGKAVDGYQLKRDVLGQVTQEARLFSSSKAWNYDRFDRVSQEKNGVPTKEIMSMKPFSQLTAQQTVTTQYAPNSQDRIRRTISKGKINTTETWGVNEKGQYHQFKGAEISYDEMGNVSEDDAAGRSIKYDLLQRPVEVADSNGTVVRRYIYGPDKRIQALVSADGTKTYNIWKGWTFLADETVAPGGGTPSARVYLHHPQGQDELIGFYERGSGSGDTLKSYYVTTRHDGSPSAVFDAQGRVVERYDYIKDGVPQVYVAGTSTPRGSSSLKQPFLFQGMYFDDVARRYLVRNRTLDPEKGAFDSVDPVDDSINWGGLYAFVGNNSVNRSDPMGTSSEPPPTIRVVSTVAGAPASDAAESVWESFCEGALEGLNNFSEGAFAAGEELVNIGFDVYYTYAEDTTHFQSNLFNAVVNDQVGLVEVADDITANALTLGGAAIVDGVVDYSTGKIDGNQFSQGMGGVGFGSLVGIAGARATGSPLFRAKAPTVQCTAAIQGARSSCSNCSLYRVQAPAGQPLLGRPQARITAQGVTGKNKPMCVGDYRFAKWYSQRPRSGPTEIVEVKLPKQLYDKIFDPSKWQQFGKPLQKGSAQRVDPNSPGIALQLPSDIVKLIEGAIKNGAPVRVVE